MAEVEIGSGKAARRAFALDDVSIVPSRRTRDVENVDTSWQIDAFAFDLPLLVTSAAEPIGPATAIEIGRLGALAVLDLEGPWGRVEDPTPYLSDPARRAELDSMAVDPALVGDRIREIKAAGITTCASVSPKRTQLLAKEVLAADLDLLVIRGTVVSAEHVSKDGEPLNLKRFVRELPIPVIVGGCASYLSALHLMRTGAAGVLVGVDADDALGVGVPQATAIADARGARMRHLDETGVYCHVIAGGITCDADVAKAVAIGADAVAIGVPPNGAEPLRALVHGLRRSMATCGYESLKEFQKAEVVVR